MMLKQTSRAAVWVGPEHYFPAPAGSKASCRTLWSERPFQVAAGQCVGVQLKGDTLMVAFRRAASRGTVQWVAAAQVLTPGEADRWATMRFTERRG
jgi:hypothetical protein